MLNNFDYLNNIWVALHNNDFNNICDEYNLCGGRKAGKTFSINELIAHFYAYIIAYPDKKIALYGFRYNSSDIQEMKKDIQDALDTIGLIESISKIKIKDGHYKYTNSQNKPTWVFPNGSFIQLSGVYKSSGGASLKGLARCKDFDLSIDWKEEANQFGNKEFQDIAFAVRGAKHRIDIRTSNPDSIYEYFINYCDSNVKFNKHELETKGEQFQLILEKYSNGSIRKKLFHYSNYQINKENLREWELSEFEELKRYDPVKYEIWGLGMPGGLETSIFSRYLKSSMRDFQPTRFYAGCDIGQADSPTGHPTTAILISANNNNSKLFCEKEYYHSNAIMQHKDSYQLASDIVNFYLDCSFEYPQLKTQGLTVYIDYGGGGAVMIDIIKKITQQLSILGENLNWLHFEPVDKSGMWLIKDRIDLIITLLSTNQFKINKNITEWTYKTMDLMEWKAPPNNRKQNYKLEPLDINDDCFDAICYAIMNIAKSLIKQLNPLFLPKTFKNIL